MAPTLGDDLFTGLLMLPVDTLVALVEINDSEPELSGSETVEGTGAVLSG